jgi:hypothetical protein
MYLVNRNSFAVSTLTAEAASVASEGDKLLLGGLSGLFELGEDFAEGEIRTGLMVFGSLKGKRCLGVEVHGAKPARVEVAVSCWKDGLEETGVYVDSLATGEVNRVVPGRSQVGEKWSFGFKGNPLALTGLLFNMFTLAR